MSCHVMLCYDMCHVMLYNMGHLMSCYVMTCVMISYIAWAMSCYITYVMSC